MMPRSLSTKLKMVFIGSLCDALGVVASDDTRKLIRGLDGFLLNNLVVTDDVEHHLGGYNRQAANLLVGEELVAHLYDALLLDLL